MSKRVLEGHRVWPALLTLFYFFLFLTEHLNVFSLLCSSCLQETLEEEEEEEAAESPAAATGISIESAVVAVASQLNNAFCVNEEEKKDPQRFFVPLGEMFANGSGIPPRYSDDEHLRPPPSKPRALAKWLLER